MCFFAFNIMTQVFMFRHSATSKGLLGNFQKVLAGMGQNTIYLYILYIIYIYIFIYLFTLLYHVYFMFYIYMSILFYTRISNLEMQPNISKRFRPIPLHPPAQQKMNLRHLLLGWPCRYGCRHPQFPRRMRWCPEWLLWLHPRCKAPGLGLGLGCQ